MFSAELLYVSTISTFPNGYQKRLLDADGTIRALSKSEPLSLEGVFTDVCILDKPNVVRRFDIGELRRNPKLLESGICSSRQPDSGQLAGEPPAIHPEEAGCGQNDFSQVPSTATACGKIDKIRHLCLTQKNWRALACGYDIFISNFEICDFPDAELLSPTS